MTEPHSHRGEPREEEQEVEREPHVPAHIASGYGETKESDEQPA